VKKVEDLRNNKLATVEPLQTHTLDECETMYCRTSVLPVVGNVVTVKLESSTYQISSTTYQ